MPKELAFQESGLYRSAVDAHKGAGFAFGIHLGDGFGHKFLASPALAGNENRQVAELTEPHGQAEAIENRWAFANDSAAVHEVAKLLRITVAGGPGAKFLLQELAQVCNEPRAGAIQ